MKLWWGRALSPFVTTTLSWYLALTQNQVRGKACDVSQEYGLEEACM